MINRQGLNEIYKPLHEKAVEILKSLRARGFEAKLCYCNLHEVLIDGSYQREYFPLPEIEIKNLAKSADLGITLGKGLWLEVTLDKEQALKLDFALLAKNFSVEVYGAQDYLTDFYSAGLDANLIAGKIEKSGEKEIHINFTFTDSSLDKITAAVESVKDAMPQN